MRNPSHHEDLISWWVKPSKDRRLAGKCWCPDCFRKKKVDVQYQLSYQSGPVNRVLFLGKLIEALIKKRMNRHTDGRDMMERNQYGFCGGKSCFASLLKSFKDSRST